MPCTCARETQDLDCVGGDGTEICNNYSPLNCEPWSRHGSSFKQHMCLGKGVVINAIGTEPDQKTGEPRKWYDDEKYTSFFDSVQHSGLKHILDNCAEGDKICNDIKKQLDEQIQKTT